MKIKTQIVKKLKISNYDESQNSKYDKTKKNQIVIKLLKSHCDNNKKNSNCDETQNSNCDEMQNSRCDITHIVMKLKNSNCDRTQKLKL